jgi:tetratricopeptide (TPR) repeat protein
MIGKERILLAVGLVVLVLAALISRPGSRATEEWNPLVSARSKHAGCVQARAKFVEDSASVYVSSKTQSPFTLPSEKVDLPPEDLELPTLNVPLPALPIPKPFPAAARCPEWVFTLGGGSGALTVKPTDLLAETDLDALISATASGSGGSEPGQPGEAPGDVVHLKDGEKIEGKIETQTRDGVWIKRKKDGLRAYCAAKDIVRVERAPIVADEYRKRAATLPKNSASAHVELAKWCEKQSLVAEAAIELEKAVSLLPREINLALQLGELYRRMTDLDREMAVYRRAVRNAPLKVERIYMKLGEVYELLGLCDRAKRAYVSAIDALPTFVPARIALAHAIVKSGVEGDLPEAQKQLEQAAQQSADVAKDPSYLLVSGLAFLVAGDIAHAKEPLKAAARENVFAASGALASCAIVEGDLAGASKHLVDAVKANPFAPASWNSLGMLYLAAGQFAPAAKAFACAYERSPVSAEARAGQALCEFAAPKPVDPKEQKPEEAAAQKLDNAIAIAQEAVKINPKSPSALIVLGRLMFEKGTLDGAEEQLKAALAAAPDFPESALVLGVLAIGRRNFQEAAAYLERIAPRYSRRLDCRCALGVAYLGLNELDKAEREFREVLRADEKNIAALNGLAYLSYVNRRASEATKRFNEVLKIDAANAYATASLKKISENVTRTLWEDSFHRSDREDIGRGWEENEARHGIAVQISKKKALFSGAQAVKDWGITSMERTVREASFLSVDADMDISRSAGAVVGVCILTQFQGGKQRGGLLLGIDENKATVYTSLASLDDAPDWKKTTAPELTADTITLGIDRAPREPGSKKAGELRLLLNGQEVGRIPESKVTTAEQLIIGVFGMARKGEKWELEVGRVRVIEKK